jgi:hypothetical protein
MRHLPTQVDKIRSSFSQAKAEACEKRNYRARASGSVISNGRRRLPMSEAATTEVGAPKPFQKRASADALREVETRLDSALASQAKTIAALARRVARLEGAIKTAGRRPS